MGPPFRAVRHPPGCHPGRGSRRGSSGLEGRRRAHLSAKRLAQQRPRLRHGAADGGEPRGQIAFQTEGRAAAEPGGGGCGAGAGRGRLAVSRRLGREGCSVHGTPRELSQRLQPGGRPAHGCGGLRAQPQRRRRTATDQGEQLYDALSPGHRHPAGGWSFPRHAAAKVRRGGTVRPPVVPLRGRARSGGGGRPLWWRLRRWRRGKQYWWRPWLVRSWY